MPIDVPPGPSLAEELCQASTWVRAMAYPRVITLGRHGARPGRAVPAVELGPQKRELLTTSWVRGKGAI